jgi:hypothetical protein
MEAKRCCWGARNEAMNVLGDLEGRKEQLRVLETHWMGIRGGIECDGKGRLDLRIDALMIARDQNSMRVPVSYFNSLPSSTIYNNERATL